MLVLTDTGDLEPDLDISKKAVQSVGLQRQKICARKSDLPVAFYLVIRYKDLE